MYFKDICAMEFLSLIIFTLSRAMVWARYLHALAKLKVYRYTNTGEYDWVAVRQKRLLSLELWGPLSLPSSG